MIATKNFGPSVTRIVTNIATHEVREEVWDRVEINGSTVYQSPSGHYYTHGIIGWICVDKYLNA